MSKPYIHAQSSQRKWGGCPEDYLAIHNWFDETKCIIADQRHRALRHHAEGIFLCERIFGTYIVNSDGRKVQVRDIGEQHVLEDFGNRFIPSAQDYLQEIHMVDWMNNGKGVPPSYARVATHPLKRTQLIEDENGVPTSPCNPHPAWPKEFDIPPKPVWPNGFNFVD
jgi:hypothetical protein